MEKITVSAGVSSPIGALAFKSKEAFINAVKRQDRMTPVVFAVIKGRAKGTMFYLPAMVEHPEVASRAKLLVRNDGWRATLTVNAAGEVQVT